MPNLMKILDGLGMVLPMHGQLVMVAAGPEDGKRWELCEKIVEKRLFGWTSFINGWGQ
jgi:hypothetical protein